MMESFTQAAPPSTREFRDEVLALHDVCFDDEPTEVTPRGELPDFGLNEN